MRVAAGAFGFFSSPCRSTPPHRRSRDPATRCRRPGDPVRRSRRRPTARCPQEPRRASWMRPAGLAAGAGGLSGGLSPATGNQRSLRHTKARPLGASSRQLGHSASPSTWATACSPFGYPQAHEHDAERAVRAGLALVEAVPKLTTAAVGGKTDFVWLVFDRGYDGSPTVGWLHRDRARTS